MSIVILAKVQIPKTINGHLVDPIKRPDDIPMISRILYRIMDSVAQEHFRLNGGDKSNVVIVDITTVKESYPLGSRPAGKS